MDTKQQIKEEEFLSDDVATQNDAVKSDLCSQEEREYFTKHLKKQMKSETITYSNNYEIQTKTEIDSQDYIMKVNSDDEMDIKEESWWLETETSSHYNDIKEGDFAPIKSPRFCIGAVTGDDNGESALVNAEASWKNTTFSYGKNSSEYESQESGVPKVPPLERHVHSKQSSKCIDETETYINNLQTHNVERSHKCNICEKSFTKLSVFKLHNLKHEGKRPHKCKICEKSFTLSGDLKRHTLIHEGKKPHKCEICEKSFTQLSNLKSHNLIHEGKKPHKCKICDMSFTHFSTLKRHNLIHEGKRPHKCEICGKSFIRLSHLKLHNLIHEGKKPHKCEVCDKSFTRLSHLKTHNLIHKGNKPHKCEVCDKSFTVLGDFKRHHLIHEGRRPHKCESCEKSFIRLSQLKRHNLIHEGT